MANLFHSPSFIALDSNGDPISGSKLNFYEAGTTTRLDTYTDNALSVAHANPVVADSAGRFAAIYLQASDYKVVWTDASDVTIKTWDPVHGTLDGTGNDFAPSQQSTPDMTVLVAAGTVYNNVTKALTVKTAQTSSVITAPVTNPRWDIIHIDRLTGVIGIDAGAEAASPSDPTISDDKLPIARVKLATTTAEITDSLITDIRELNLIGAGDLVRYSFVDEDDMTSDSAVLVPSQQSVKAYVDASRTAIDVQSFTTAGADTWTKPSGYAATSKALAQLWAGAGSGGRGTATSGGGGGGGYAEAWFTLSDLGATETLAIGAGGAALGANGQGNAGVNTTFGTLLTAYRGGGGGQNTTGGGGGGLFTVGENAGSGGDGGDPLAGAGGSAAAGGASTFGGGGGGDGIGNPGGASVWGGGGGGGEGGGDGGNSYYGGGGGGGEENTTGGSGGTSVLGGNGGAGGSAGGVGGDGSQPGGGGGGSDDTTSGAGGDGQIIVTVFPA